MVYYVCSSCHLSVRADPRDERREMSCPRCLGRHGKRVVMLTSPLYTRDLTAERLVQPEPAR